MIFCAKSRLLLLLLLLSGIINVQLLSWLRPGSAVINGGRGRQLVEADMLAALDRGQVGLWQTAH
jgi:glyoxylate/hydroxypyruvate reductase A